MITIFLFRNDDGRYLAVNESDTLEFFTMPNDHNEIKSICWAPTLLAAENWLKWLRDEIGRSTKKITSTDKIEIIPVNLP